MRLVTKVKGSKVTQWIINLQPDLHLHISRLLLKYFAAIYELTIILTVMSPDRIKHVYSCKYKEKWYQNFKRYLN